ncbi:MAG: hypothetical protein ACR2FN_11410 [Chitinophagaceae bacterium]
MQTNFEKNIKEKLDDFHLTPSQQVWEDVAASLNTNKKRRVFGWWIYATGFLIIICVSWWLITHNFSSQKTITSKNNNQQAVKVIPQINSSNNNSIINKSNLNKQTVNNFSISSLKKNDLIRKNNQQQIISTNLIEQNIVNVTAINNLNSSKRIVPDFNTYLFPSAAQNKTFETSSLNSTNNFNTIADISNKKYKANKPKKWFFLISGGTTNTTNKDFLFRTDNNLIYQLPGNTRADTLRQMKQAYTGAHITAGVEYRQQLTQHWALYSGLQYSFLLNHQRTGNKYIGPTNISRRFDTSSSPSGRFVKIPYHYVTGVNVTHTNYTNWLELPVSVGYTINPKAHTKLELKSGGSIAYMMYDHWLIPDGRYNKFYYSKELTNYYIVNLHADAIVTLSKNKTVGIQWQHSITPLAKNPVQPSVYWSNISIFTTIPLK